ncbi:hypothetical protein JXQ70_09610, partial [bacterium]|nr:hypothetical protein [bacterium]
NNRSLLIELNDDYVSLDRRALFIFRTVNEDGLKGFLINPVSGEIAISCPWLQLNKKSCK